MKISRYHDTPLFPLLHAHLPRVIYWPVCWAFVVTAMVVVLVAHLLVPPKYIPKGWEL